MIVVVAELVGVADLVELALVVTVVEPEDVMLAERVEVTVVTPLEDSDDVTVAVGLDDFELLAVVVTEVEAVEDWVLVSVVRTHSSSSPAA